MLGLDSSFWADQNGDGRDEVLTGQLITSDYAGSVLLFHGPLTGTLDLDSIANGRDIPKAMLQELSADGMRNAFIIEKVEELLTRQAEMVMK